jgi:N-glycosylase/DNA lyase
MVSEKQNLLVQQIEKVKRSVREQVEQRYEEFKKIGENGDEVALFGELSFCILTANWTAKGGMKAQNLITNEGFSYLKEIELVSKLKKIGHRFPNTRAKYIVENRWIIGKMKDILKMDVKHSRIFLAENVKGIGWKESSHFLRNVGKDDVAILDKHILRIMKNYDLLKELPKPSWNEKKYTEIEKILRTFAKKINEPLGKLDLFLWYMETGSIDK